MKEILSQRGFSQEEIATLEKRDDYEEVQKRIQELQTNSLLDELEARTVEGVNREAQSLEQRWEQFKKDIAEVQTQGNSQNTPKETVEEMQARLKEEATNLAEKKIREKMSGIPLIGDMLANWMVEGGKNLISEGKDTSFGGKIKNWILMLVAGIFGVDTILKGLQDDVATAANATLPNIPQVPDIPETPQVPEVTDEDKDILVYESGLSLILALSEDDDNNENIRSIFNQKTIKESSYTEILSSQLTVEGFSGDDVHLMQKTLQSQEGLINSILGKEYPNWKDMKLVEIFKKIAKYGDVFSQLENISPEDILSGTVSFGNISLVGDSISGGLGKLFEENISNPESLLHGVNKGLFLELMRDNTKKITNPTVLSGLKGNVYNSEADNKFEEDFVDFGTNFINTISDNFFLGNPEYRIKFQEYFNTRSLSLKEVLEFYIITGGERDASSYNDAVKTIIYTKIWGILGEESGVNYLRINTYNNAIRTVIEGGIVEGQENIPPQLIIIGARILREGEGMVEKAIYQVGNLLAEAWGFLTPGEKIVLAASATFGLLLLFRSRLLIAKARGIGIGVEISIVLVLMTMSRKAFANEGFRENHPEMKSAEDVLNALLIEVGQRGIPLNDAITSMQSSDSSIGTQGLDFSKLDGDIPVLDTSPIPEGSTLSNYRSYIIYQDILKQDGMELISGEGDIIEERYGRLTVRKNKINLEVSFLIDNIEKSVYFKSGPSGSVLKNILADLSFVKDSSGKVFLAFPLGGVGRAYHYVSLEELEQRISSSEQGEYLVAEDVYLYWDLFIEGKSLSPSH